MVIKYGIRVTNKFSRNASPFGKLRAGCENEGRIL